MVNLSNFRSYTVGRRLEVVGSATKGDIHPGDKYDKIY